MAYDEHLAERIRGVLRSRDNVTEKKMFGGIAFMVGGNMAVGVTRDELMVRVGPDAHDEALSQPHVRVMDMGNRPMRGMVKLNTLPLPSSDDSRAICPPIPSMSIFDM